MLFYTHYRKFVDRSRCVKLVWHWNRVLPGEFAFVRWYHTCVSDLLRRRFLRRKLHNAEDAALYAVRVCRKWHALGK